MPEDRAQGYTRLNLQVIAKAEKFNYWLYQQIAPYCQGKILEIGSGSGNISQFFVADKKEIYLSDYDPSFCQMLKQKFPQMSNDRILNINAEAEDLLSENRALYHSFDTVVAVNVVEHLHDDKLALKNMYSLLRKNGKIVILVPAFQMFYNKLDRNLNHYRRYSYQKLELLLKEQHLEPVNIYYFNFSGMFGWFVAGKILQYQYVTANFMRVYHWLMPLNKLLDRTFNGVAGLSLIAVAQKSG